MAVAVGLGVVVQLRDRQSAGKWYAAAAFLPSLLLLHCVIPANIENRYMIPAAPMWLMFFAAGACWLSRRLPWPTARRLRVVPLALLALFVVEAFDFPRKNVSGFGEAARAIVADSSLEGSILLIASDGTGEGVFVAAIALSEKRLGHIVLRASNVLCDDDFYGRNYRALFSTTAELMAWLREIPVGLIDFGSRTEVPFKELVLEILELVDDVVDEYDLRKDVEYVHTILEQGTSADRQLATFERTGSLESVVDQVIEETREGCDL